MVRTYTRKTNRGSWCPKNMEEATIKVKSNKMTMRQAAEIYNVPYTSLQRRISSNQNVVKCRGWQPIMDEEAEKQLADRLIHLASRGFGITPKNVRKYAYDFAVLHNLKHTFNTDKKMAGQDWFRRFIKRNKNITIRKPEGLSRARFNGLKKDKVLSFYEILEKVIDSNNVRGRPE